MPPWIYPDLYDPDQSNLFQGFVYEIENLQTGRKYVGKKFTMAKRKGKMVQSDWKRYWGSSTDLCLDIKRFGHDQFRRTILYFCLTRAATNFHETEELFIRKVLSATLPNGERAYYNRSIMGKFFVSPETLTDETKAKIAAAKRGKKASPETKAKMSAVRKGKTRRPPSPETRQRMSLAQMGKKQSEETIAKRSATRTGRKASQTHRENISAALRGHKLSPETRMKISAARGTMTEDQVRIIRGSSETIVALATVHGVNPSVIQRIRAGTSYKWVTP